MMRPQCLKDIGLTIGDEYSQPNRLKICDEDVSPGIDTEIVEETQGVIDALLYDDGTDAGFVLVQES